MGVDLHITRAGHWAKNEHAQISSEEWLRYIESDPELHTWMENGKHFARWSGPSKHDEPWLDWFQGNIYTKWPDTALYRKMLRIAEAFDAKVQDDDGTNYLKPTDWIFDPTENRKHSSRQHRQSWWKRLLGARLSSNIRAKKRMSKTRITTAPWVYGVLAFCMAFCTLGVALLNAGERGWEFWGTVMLLVLFSLSLLAAAMTKIENNGEFVMIVENFKRIDILKTLIENVSWEKGAGAHLKLASGKLVKLPATGRNDQGVTNSVRSWLVRP